MILKKNDTYELKLFGIQIYSIIISATFSNLLKKAFN